jgi:hypothetical protein
MNFSFKQIDLKNNITLSLESILKTSEMTNMGGSLTLRYKGFTIAEFDQVLESVDGFDRRDHHFFLRSDLFVSVLLD